jgi:hypothetical protein
MLLEEERKRIIVRVEGKFFLKENEPEESVGRVN